jgi:hypothetical protein
LLGHDLLVGDLLVGYLLRGDLLVGDLLVGCLLRGHLLSSYLLRVALVGLRVRGNIALLWLLDRRITLCRWLRGIGRRRRCWCRDCIRDTISDERFATANLARDIPPSLPSIVLL